MKLATRFASLLLFSSLAAHSALAGTVTAVVRPDSVWIERGRGAQFLSFEFEFGSEADDTLEITHIDVQALDREGRTLAKKFIGMNGLAPSILTIPRRDVSRGRPLIVFNPFPEWDGDLPLATLRYRFELESEARAETLVAEVHPREFVQKARLVLPIAGRILVFDAHDPLAHHRRVDLTHPVAAQLGLKRNSGRYAYDLSVVDETASMWRTDGGTNGDWWSWEVPIRAPGDGKVVGVWNDREDWEVGRTALSIEAILSDPTTLFGNSVIIDHGNGEFSQIAHMRRGSVRVKTGDVVRQGDRIGSVGYSGSVFTVHVHYELRTGVDLGVEGLPSKFANVDRWIGGKRVPVKDGFITTGDILESR